MHAEQGSPSAAAVQQHTPAAGKRSRSVMEAAGGQLSRVDLSKAAAVIAASLPAAPHRSPSSNSSAERAEEGAAASHEQHLGGHKPRSPAVAVHGNYHRYYGYRLGQAIDRDPRLEARCHPSLSLVL